MLSIWTQPWFYSPVEGVALVKQLLLCCLSYTRVWIRAWTFFLAVWSLLMTDRRVFWLWGSVMVSLCQEEVDLVYTSRKVSKEPFFFAAAEEISICGSISPSTGHTADTDCLAFYFQWKPPKQLCSCLKNKISGTNTGFETLFQRLFDKWGLCTYIHIHIYVITVYSSISVFAYLTWKQFRKSKRCRFGSQNSA